VAIGKSKMMSVTIWQMVRTKGNNLLVPRSLKNVKLDFEVTLIMNLRKILISFNDSGGVPKNVDV
jgi:hypothetical protein